MMIDIQPEQGREFSMIAFRNAGLDWGMTLIALAIMLAGVSCSSAQLPKGMVGRLGKYDYSPSVIQTGNVRQFWWCGLAKNPTNPAQQSDAILYESVDLVTGATTGPLTVMAETVGAWDSTFTCNPKVIEGSFDNPLRDGQTFQYAMYYVGTNDGATNNIGVAFSNDGIKWKKYPDPVILKTSATGYGVGQPALYNVDHKAAIRMFYEDSNPTIHHVAAISTDGVHFTVQGTMTDNGLDPDSRERTWGDMAYDAKTGFWYAVFDRPLRDRSTTGDKLERGQLGVELYKIPDSALLTGSTPWQILTTIDTNITGFESNFIGAFVRDAYGNLNVGSFPTIQMYISVSDPQPRWDSSPEEAGDSGREETWDIAPVEWVPGQPLRALNRYVNSTAHLVTTGWVSPAGDFQEATLLGHLYESAQQGATVPLYACARGRIDHFLSLDSACEGQRIVGTTGYAYAAPVAGMPLIPLYRCSTRHDHFASNDPKCEGATMDKLLAYVLP